VFFFSTVYICVFILGQIQHLVSEPRSFDVRVVNKMRHRREHEGESPASCGTGGGYEVASVSRRHARGEGVGGAPLVEARGDNGNRRDKMALAAVHTLLR
jgi:hypothetical protein